MIDKIFQSIRLGEKQSFLSIIDAIDINTVNELEQNMLHEAIAYDQPDIVEILLQRRINVNQRDVKGQTPLHYCGLKNMTVFAREILAYGGNHSAGDNYGNEPLWTAVFNARGEYDTVDLLIKSGANPNHKNNNGKSPLDFANQIGDEDLILLLGGDKLARKK